MQDLTFKPAAIGPRPTTSVFKKRQVNETKRRWVFKTILRCLLPTIDLDRAQFEELERKKTPQEMRRGYRGDTRWML